MDNVLRCCQIFQTHWIRVRKISLLLLLVCCNEPPICWHLWKLIPILLDDLSRYALLISQVQVIAFTSKTTRNWYGVAAAKFFFRLFVDSFTVALHSHNDRHLSVVGTVRTRGCRWPLKTVEIFTGYVSPQCIAKRVYMIPSNWRPCLIPTDSDTATRLGLRNNLVCSAVITLKFPVIKWYDRMTRIPKIERT